MMKKFYFIASSILCMILSYSSYGCSMEKGLSQSSENSTTNSYLAKNQAQTGEQETTKGTLESKNSAFAGTGDPFDFVKKNPKQKKEDDFSIMDGF